MVALIDTVHWVLFMLYSMASTDVSRCQTPASGHKELIYTRNQGSNYIGYAFVCDGRGNNL